MGANSAPRRQNCRGWEKMPLQAWETLSPLLPFSHKDEAESHHPPVDQETGGVGKEDGAGIQGEMNIPIKARG